MVWSDDEGFNEAVGNGSSPFIYGIEQLGHALDQRQDCVKKKLYHHPNRFG